MNSYKKICDRCGKEIKDLPISRITSVKIIAVFGHSPYSYSENKFELCRDCSNDLEKFIYKKL